MITVTAAAKQLLVEKLTKANKISVLFGLESGGCAGFSYAWEPMDETEQQAKAEQLGCEIELGDGKKLFIDKLAEMYLVGSTVDVKDDFIGSSLVVETPNAVGSCGCGTSVNIQVDTP